MSIYSNVTEQHLINLRKLAEQQKEQRALEIKNRILKQTHDIKLAESLSPITKKLEEDKQSTKNLGDVLKDSNSERQNNQEFLLKSKLLQESKFLLKLNQKMKIFQLI